MKIYLLSLMFDNMFSKLLLSILAFIMPLSTLFHFIFLTISIDFITGIWKSIKNKNKINSKGLYKTIQKIFLYMIIIILIAAFEKMILGLSTLYLTTYVMGFVSLTEIFSTLENIAEITGNKSILSVKDIILNIFKKKEEQL